MDLECWIVSSVEVPCAEAGCKRFKLRVAGLSDDDVVK